MATAAAATPAAAAPAVAPPVTAAPAAAAAHGHGTTATKKLRGARTAAPANPDLIFLFDVDGTLTVPRQGIEDDMIDYLYDLRNKGWVAVVGGSDQTKILEQLGEHAHTFFDYLFSENGLVGVKEGSEFHRRQLSTHFGEEDRKGFETFCLTHINGLVLPTKCSNHVEARSGMWNVSPIGRTCTKAERDAFEQYDHIHKVREKMVNLLRPQFAKMNLSYAIGGQISFDVYPKGWDKTYCLQFLTEHKQVHFFGDKTYAGGNDYEIYTSHRTIGHCTTGPKHTMKLIGSVFDEHHVVRPTEAGAREALAPLFASAKAPSSIVDLIVGYANYFYSQ